MLTLDSWIRVNLLSEQTLKEIAATLKELLKWSKLAGIQQLRNVLAHNLKTDIEMLIYELSDGSRGTREIARLAGIGSNSTVANYWRKWSKVGIVEPSEKFPGRYQRICSLEEVGLTVPQVAMRTQTEQEKSKEDIGIE